MTRAPHPVTLRQLQYLDAVAELRSFRRAADACRVSQPSLSAQVAQAEEALGLRLFERGRRGVLLTRSGEEVLERLRRVLLAADDLVEAARRCSDPLAGSLRLGVLPTIGPYLLPAAVRALRVELPRLSVLWEEDRTAALVQRVSAGGLDGALVAAGPDLGELVSEPLATDPFLLAVSREHPLARQGQPVGGGELRDTEMLLLDDGHCLRTQALDVCRATRARELDFRATSLATLVQMVASGAGATLLPALACRTELARADLVLRPFAGPAPARTLVLAWRRRSAVEPALRNVARVLASAAQEAIGVLPPPSKPRPGPARRRAPSEGARRGRRRGNERAGGAADAHAERTRART